MDCPKCHKKAEKGHKCNAPKVLQVNQVPEIVTFHTVELQSEAAFPIANGAYRNTVVSYIEDSSVYLYNSDGIPVKLSPEAIREFNQLAGRPKYGGQEMTSATDIPDLTGDVQSLSSSLSSEEEARILADQGLAGDIAAEALARGNADTAINNAVDSINTAINKTVVTDLAVDPNPSTTVVSLDNTKTNIKTGASTTSALPLPVASSTQAGVMNSATFNALSQNSSDINALINGAVAVSGISASPAQADLTTAWEAETGIASLMNRASIFDVDNDKVWTYYTNTATWYPASSTAQVIINTFTNSAEGTIKGSTNVGQVFAENDGTGSVNGWDALSATVSTHTSQIAGKADTSSLASVATSGAYLDLSGRPTALSGFTNDLNKLGGVSVGGTTTPVYFSNGTPTACARSAPGDRWGVLPYVDVNGYTEVGKALNFHLSDNDNSYATRMTIPSAGTLAVSGTVYSNTTSATAGYNLVQEKDTWKKIGTATLASDTTASTLLTVAIPSAYQSATDYEYKVFFALESGTKNSSTTYVYLQLQSGGDWKQSVNDYAYVRMAAGGMTNYSATSVTAVGTELRIVDPNDSGCGEVYLGKPGRNNWWNFTGHAGGISAGQPYMIASGGRTRYGTALTGVRLWTNGLTLRFLAGSHLSVWARKVT